MLRISQLKLILPAMIAVLFLAACSFQPLYGPTASGLNVSTELASVEIDTIPGRVGQRLRNELIFKTRGGNHAAPVNYKLEVSIRESVLGVNVERSGDSSGRIYALQSNFKLINIADKKVLFEGTSRARAGFDKFNSNFSNIRAQIDAENRTARVMANDIKTRLAAFLSRSS